MVERSVNSLRDIASAARGRRLELGLSQAAVAKSARVSRQWVNEFEAGKPGAELALTLRLIETLGLTLSLRGADLPHDRAREGTVRPDDQAVAVRTWSDDVAEPSQVSEPRPVDLDQLLERYRRR